MRPDDSVQLSGRNMWWYSNCEKDDLFMLPLTKELCWQMELLPHHDFIQWEKRVCETGKDVYLYISLDKVDTAVPTCANLLLPFCSERPSWMEICLWNWMPVKGAKLWPRRVFQVRNGYNLRFKCEVYLRRNFKNAPTCSNATMPIHSRLAASLLSPLKPHNWRKLALPKHRWQTHS